MSDTTLQETVDDLKESLEGAWREIKILQHQVEQLVALALHGTPERERAALKLSLSRSELISVARREW